MEYSESLEMYLETMYDILKEGGPILSVEVASRLGVSKPSVNRALKVLKEDGLIHHEPYGSITLSPSGLNLAKKIRERHDTIAAFLMATLNIPASIADKDACRMEHILSPETLEAIKNVI